MLVATIHGFRYCRLLTETLTPEEGERLAAEFDYVFVVCYGECLAPMYEITPKNACLIDLKNGAEVAFSRFHATTRNEVRRSNKIPELRFQQGAVDDFETFFSFYKSSENARGWYPAPPEELRNSLVFTAFFEEKPISGMSLYTHGNRLRIGRIFSLRRVEQERINNLIHGCASKRLVWEICRYAAGNGFQTLDLGGLDLESPEKSGITRFKLSFGGQVAPVKIARFATARFQAESTNIRVAGLDVT